MLHEKIIKIINKINPNAEFSFSGDSLEEITFQWTNGTTPIAKSEIEAMIPTIEAEIEQEKKDAINKKATAKQKLIDLGLTEEEVKALIGV
tara:strand:- start:184 stop:456 length:273 start_codon:yes stop_codon:yes gene_type:complete